MAELVLHQHVDAVPQMIPPKLPVMLLRLHVVTVILERHLAKLIQAMRLVKAIERCHICVVSKPPILVWIADSQVRVLSEANDVGTCDGEHVFGFKALPQTFGFGFSGLEATPSGILGRPQGAIELDVVKTGIDIVENRCLIKRIFSYNDDLGGNLLRSYNSKMTSSLHHLSTDRLQLSVRIVAGIECN